ncbi:MAG TPA: molybdopterin-binding protein, partial [Lacipirellulaceae bacterium]|nr:molybdopterin-binding protein [Lacipirellulaceae bacterium]
ELVDVDQPLAPGQIRNSNGPMLLAAVETAGASAINLGVARDDPAELRAAIAKGLESDVLLVSGGVSAGVKDLAPGIFVDLGVSQEFHQVRIKPGKPLWFGVYEAAGRRALVFGLPGNPVSTLVSFKLFVEPALATLGGAPFVPPVVAPAVLAAPVQHRGKRPTYLPCRVTAVDAETGLRAIEGLDWKGSADLATLARADGLAALAEGDYELPAGTAVSMLPL